jgi:hypothetical protein
VLIVDSAIPILNVITSEPEVRSVQVSNADCRIVGIRTLAEPSCWQGYNILLDFNNAHLTNSPNIKKLILSKPSPIRTQLRISRLSYIEIN